MTFPRGSDLQALLFGHLRRPLSRHLLFRFGPPAGARRMLAGLADGPVTFGDSAEIPMSEPLMSLGITSTGLRALGVEEGLIAKFDPRFRDGLAPKRMGDHPETHNHFENWWERRFVTEDVHCIVHLYALDEAQLEERTRALGALATDGDVTELIPRDDGTRLDGAFVYGPRRLHFGYTDGISAPHVAWDHPPEAGEVDFRRFVLGYATPEHASAPRDGAAADLVRGSTYGVFRWVYQDVAAFNRFLATEAPRLFAELAPADAEELLAAKLMGRWRDGTPLVLSPDRPDPALADSDDFLYRETDPHGLRCPFSAHIRVMNPRDQELHATVAEVPTVLRRGTPYGPPLAGAEDDGADRGLIGVFLGANILRQVLTLTMWAKQNDFSPVYAGSMRVQDAMIGSRAPSADPSFTVPGVGVIERLPSFIRTKGTALALYPGRNTLEALARCDGRNARRDGGRRDARRVPTERVTPGTPRRS
jgi:deferrochelatase/peroxidase EfeB